MDPDVRQRLAWIKLYEQTGNAGLTCLRCGISRPTLRKWIGRYAAAGEEGLRSQSRRPKRSPRMKLTDQVLTLIRELRR